LNGGRNRVPEALERRVVEMAIEQPAWRPKLLVNELAPRA
jgi:hypothetical protein